MMSGFLFPLNNHVGIFIINELTRKHTKNQINDGDNGIHR